MQIIARMADRFKTTQDAASLGARMRIARIAARLTLTELASSTGVDAGHISKIERGMMVTFSPNVQKICTYLDVEISSPAFGVSGDSSVATRIESLLARSCISERALSKLVAALEEVAAEVSGKHPAN